ncbi:hypothetical protein IJ541_10550 [bacterium]|nr:hypothetical protein [bacterium]
MPKDIFFKNLENITKPLLFIGSDDEETDKLLIPEIINRLNKKNCIIANITERNYKQIIPHVIKHEHYAVLKSPIDINLAKELNILAIEMGLPHDKIIMNTDIGGLGYGYEYGFSIMEKIKLEKDDKFLNFPIFTDASTEALKTKEAKSNDFTNSWGSLDKRAKMIELCACTGVISAGANIVVVHYPENIKYLKGIA